MSESQNPALHDQSQQPVMPIEVPLAPMQEYAIPFGGDSIIDPTAVGLPPQPDGTSYTILEQLTLGKAEGVEDAKGVGLFVVQLHNPSGAKEVGLMGSRLDESGTMVATYEWEPLAGDGEVVVGRGPQSSPDEQGRERRKVQIEGLSAELSDGAGRRQAVSREHLGVRYDYRQQRVVVRDLGSTNGTRRVEYPAPAEAVVHPQPRSEAVGGVALVGGRVLIDRVPNFGKAKEPAAEVSPTPQPEVDRDAIARQVEALTKQIRDDSRIGGVEHALTQVRELEEDIQENWADSRKPKDQQKYHNHGQYSHELQRRKGAYERDVDGYRQSGLLAQHTADPRVQERDRLRRAIG